MRLANVAESVRAANPSVHQLFVTNARNIDFLYTLGIPAVVLPQDDGGPWGTSNRRSKTVSYGFNARLLTSIISTYAPTALVFDTYYPSDVVVNASVPSFLVLRDAVDEYFDIRMRSGTLQRFRKIVLASAECEFRANLDDRLFGELRDSCNLAFVGTISRRPQPQLLPDLLEKYTIRPEDRVVVVSIGGGGYEHSAGRFFSLIMPALKRLQSSFSQLRILVFAGPYAKCAPKELGVETVPWEANLPTLLMRADLYITHGGYNSVAEVLSSGVRAVVVPLERKFENQGSRTRLLAESGRVFQISSGLSIDSITALFLRAIEQPRFEALAPAGNTRAAEILMSELLDGDPLPQATQRACGESALITTRPPLSALGRHPRVFVEREGFVVAALSSTAIAGLVIELTTIVETCAAEGHALSKLLLTLQQHQLALLPRLIAHSHSIPFHSLVVEVNTSSLPADEIFKILEQCRYPRPQHRIDIVDGNGDFVICDQP